MKRFLLILAVAAVLVADFAVFGCVPKSGDPIDGDRVIRAANAIYLDIRTVVTDPEVRPMFSPAELDKLAELERNYLDVADRLREFPDDEAAIQQISWLATEILGTLDEVAFVEGARPYIAAIRISIQILRNHMR